MTKAAGLPTPVRRVDARGLILEIHDRATDPAAFGDFEAIVRLWRERAGERPFPSWRNFDIPDFSGWFGRMMIFEGGDLRWRLFGGEFVTLMGHDYTGRTLEEMFRNNRPEIGAKIRDHLRAVIETGGIGYSRGPLFPFRERMLATWVVDLPLAGTGDVPESVLCLFRIAARKPG